VVNPVSGDGCGVAMLEPLRASLGGDWHVDANVTGGPGETAAAGRSFDECDLLAIVGGDGTVREVASGFLNANTDPPPLFVVPAGRGNSLYRHLYGDTDWRAVASRVGRALDARPLDAGHYETDTETGHFLLGFTAGLFRAAVEASETFDRLPGPLAYLLGMGRAVLRQDPVEVRLGADGTTLYEGSAHLVAVGGGRYRGSNFDVLPASRPADGNLHALVVEATGLLDVVGITRAGPSGRHVDHPAVHYHSAPAFDLSSAAGLPVEVDGSVVPEPVREASLAVRPGALSYAAPTGF
jgi:diacylglycerol kinase (ATP)